MTTTRSHFLLRQPATSHKPPSPDSATLRRRDFLKAGAALLPASLLAQTPAPRGPIDVHHHFTPPFYLQEIKDATGFNPRPWTPEISLAAMDKHNIATSLLSPVQRVVADTMSDRSARARSLARRSNEYNAQVVRDHPGRFGLLAALPLPDTEGSLKEIEYAYDTLHADGIALWTSYIDKWPGDPAFFPVFEELNRRNAVVFFHPTTASCCRNLIPGLSISGIFEYDLDTARCAESILINGMSARFPNLRLILSHSGGAFTTLAARMIDDYPKNFADRVPRGVEYEIKKFYYEVAHGSKPPSLDALRDLVPVSQILFGSDVPIRAYELTLDGLDHYTGFSPADLRAIYRTNAEHLFPRLKA